MAESIRSLYTLPTRRTKQLLEKAKLTENSFLIILAIVIGILGGFAAVGIRALIKEISAASFVGDGTLLENIINAPWYLKLGIPVAGGLLVGPIIHFFAKEAKGHGVPEVMQSIILKGGMIRPRVAFIKAIASAITIGTGGSVGREGPIIQIGASLGSTVGQLFKIPGKRLKTLVGCGAAAGIAAAFNAPIAGALFAAEILLMDFTVASFSPIVISSVMATVVSHSIEGNFAAFQVPSYELVSPYELGFYFLLGGLAGLTSFGFIKALYFSEDFFENKFNFPEYLKPAIGGLAIGGTAFIFPQVLGIGYESIGNALHGDLIWYVALILIFVKIIATSLTLGSGGSGGIFAPSLFMGAMLGVFFGSFAHQYFPEITASPGAYALVAMGGLVAGTTRAPITAIIIVFELTNDYNIILPLMIVCIMSTLISSKLSRESIYTLKLILRGINIRGGQELNVMESLMVKDVYTTKYDPIFANDNFNQVVNRIIRGKGPEFPVLEQRAEVLGFISIHDIKDYLFEKDSLQDLLIAADLSSNNFENLLPSDNCHVALDKMSRHDMEGLPVVDEKNPKKMIGMIWRKDILDEYQKEIERRELTYNLADGINQADAEKNVQFMQGYSITEIQPPKIFIGKSIKDLRVRSKYGVDVLSIKSHTKKSSEVNLIPNPNYVIKEGDTIVVAGEIRNINILKNVG
ncbi:MAG: chloride channel protein [Melioribacteraceae bacterium]|nr:chloride channel protein [Melioribacteraceae bacterium]MCF8264685.1 chloride channel protein [Melioribacteraceae bacterium]MCF8413462.1 chloride channel protein [Melioribacteraceae bacterium]MCF8432564.1 chloride channel protein [Melioribacteraceae bacterium]